MLLQIYKDAFGSFDLGRAAAGSMVMAILLLWFSTWNMRVLNRGYIAER